jgi:hypothetical protein
LKKGDFVGQNQIHNVNSSICTFCSEISYKAFWNLGLIHHCSGSAKKCSKRSLHKTIVLRSSRGNDFRVDKDGVMVEKQKVRKQAIDFRNFPMLIVLQVVMV